MMQPEEIKALLEKYVSGGLTDAEKAMLESWYIKQADSNDVPLDEYTMQQNLRQMTARLPVQKSSPALLHRLWPKVAAAAIVLLTGSAIWFLTKRPVTEKPVLAATTAPQMVSPGKDGAILTLADGRQIILDSTGDKIIANQNGARVLLEDGRLVYKSLTAGNRQNDRSAISYNTVATPRGRQFQLVLPDGTKVWLNAASSIHYPTAFTGSERRVEITGEAYFEVAHDKSKPFHVRSNKQEVEVLGTHFNIMAYDDEPAIKTTLLEGKVKVHSNTNVILEPGEQAIVNGKIKVALVNTEAAVAWKNGEFMFRNEPLENIMRSIARWYDAEIIYKTDVSKKAVWGTVTKYSNVSDVLNMITLTGVAHFRVEGKKIIVLP
jgi:Fe2+-dicitrate sensor, membrane component